MQPPVQNPESAKDSAPQPAPVVVQVVPALHTWLLKRNIDPAALQTRAPEVYTRWQALFTELQADSFLNQIRFELNAVRRRSQGLV